jgi:hypothetical protein
MVEEMINGIDLQVVELNFAWKVKFCVLMAGFRSNQGMTCGNHPCVMPRQQNLHIIIHMSYHISEIFTS